MDCDNIMCKQLTFIGKSPSSTNIIRKNDITIKRNNISYRISTSTIFCDKVITINTENDISFNLFFSLLCEIIRFENLFDGVFFIPTSITADLNEHIDEILKKLIPYYVSQERYIYFNLKMNDKTYKHYFVKWTKLSKEIKIIHQVYLYNAFVKGNPIDIRFSLLLELFEPLAEVLKSKGKITLVSTPSSPIICPKCNFTVANGKKISPTFKQKLKSITDIYKKTIFKGDYKNKMLRQAVNLRNRVFHVDSDKKEFLNGSRCGVYFYKFALMYRCIIFSLLGLSEYEYMPIAEGWLKDFNIKYGAYLIKS